MAVRSVGVVLINQTGYPLQLTNSGLSHGEWSSSLQPPAEIANGDSAYNEPPFPVTFQSEDDGIMTGTQGSAIYQVLDNNPTQPDPNNPGPNSPWIPVTSWIYLSWDNPYVGSTSFNSKMEVQQVDLNDSPVNPPAGGGSAFTFKLPISNYEVGYIIGPADGSTSDTNWGDLVLVPYAYGFLPVIAIINLLGDSGGIANAIVNVLVRTKATDAITWAKRNNVDLTKGFRVIFRALNVLDGSLRALFQLPPTKPSGT